MKLKGGRRHPSSVPLFELSFVFCFLESDLGWLPKSHPGSHWTAWASKENRVTEERNWPLSISWDALAQRSWRLVWVFLTLGRAHFQLYRSVIPPGVTPSAPCQAESVQIPVLFRVSRMLWSQRNVKMLGKRKKPLKSIGESGCFSVWAWWA